MGRIGESGQTSNPHVEVRGVTKRFGGTVALDDVHVSFQKGTIHALVGENGAGKSTLGKLIAGVLTPDDGKLVIDGEEVEFRSPRQALGHGITMVAQELSLVPALTLLENVFLGIETGRGPFLTKAGDLERFDELTSRYGIEANTDATVRDLPVAQQQKVEILRALARHARLIVMDEPTARLTSAEARSLRDTVRTLKREGVTVVYISHFVEECLDIADIVTVMRDGRIVRTSPAKDETPASLIEGIVGRSLDSVFPRRVLPGEDVRLVLVVDSLSRRGAFSNISFTVRAGEIVTLAGIVGAGRTEVARAIFGADPLTSGVMLLNSRPYRPRSPADAINAGVAMIPESRNADGLFPALAVRPNLTMPHLRRFTGASGLVDRKAERSAARKTATDVEITGATVEHLMAQLSGGNQQKTLFGRWILARPALLIADEPTRGVDIGAKRSIYKLIADLAADGIAILMVSSELEEVLGVSHRILVMRGGRLRGEIAGADATEERVMELALGTSHL